MENTNDIRNLRVLFQEQLSMLEYVIISYIRGYGLETHFHCLVRNVTKEAQQWNSGEIAKSNVQFTFIIINHHSFYFCIMLFMMYPFVSVNL